MSATRRMPDHCMPALRRKKMMKKVGLERTENGWLQTKTTWKSCRQPFRRP